MSPSTPPKPLSGVRVIEFGQFIAGPGATQILADLGADVVKVESPNGDNGRRFGASEATQLRSGLFTAYNRGKRSVVLDMRLPEGLALARKLALQADVVVQNLRPGTAEALGLDAATLRREKRTLIHVSISGFGEQGPSSRRPGLDIAAQAESGMMSVTGERNGVPLKAGFAVADVSAANAAAQAVLAAYIYRLRTGNGETIETSLLAASVAMQAQLWGEYQYTGHQPQRAGNAQPLVAPAADLIEVRDGHIVISAYIDAHWRRFCAAIGKAELADDPRFSKNSGRVAHRAEIIAVAREALGHLSGEEARELLERHSVVVGVVRDYAQVLASADVRACGVFKPVEDATGTRFLMPALPFRFERETGAASDVERAPGLGEHTVEVLREAGLEPHEIERLQACGAACSREAGLVECATGTD
ncbi:CaiB/BaiF CoA transferase family protein [Piscinibacter sakaiensis]|uniref:CaiB/BaiF CoA transferase family protein n=1 Tax=Piscinibacter sakaiensis TaxID=1547922 RepID=UPI003AABA409